MSLHSIVQGMAFLLLSGRGAIPEVLSRNMGNSLLFGGFSLECVAAWVLVGRTRWREVVLPVLVISLLVMNGGILAGLSGAALVAVASFSVAILMIICSMALPDEGYASGHRYGHGTWRPWLGRSEMTR